MNQDKKPQGKKTWTEARIYSEDLFESKALACLKVSTGGPADCSNLFPGASKVS